MIPNDPAWQHVGAPPAGAVTALAIGQDDGGRAVFVGSKAGLHRAGRLSGAAAPAWARLAGAPIGVLSLAVSPAYARDHTLVAGAEAGIFLSRDGGDTWAAAQMPYSQSPVLTVCFSPNFAADGIILAGTLEDGVWLSNNGGLNWAARNFGLMDAAVFCLAVSPDFAADETVYAGTDTTLYYSYNGARAWKAIDLPDGAAPVISLAASPEFASDHTLFAGTEQCGAYCSVNRGRHWRRLNLAANTVNVLLATHPGRVLAATETGIHVSPDQGTTWHCAADIPDVISLAANDGLALAGSADQGAWMAAGPAGWRPVSTPAIRSVSGLALSPAFDRAPLAWMCGLQEGIWRTTDGGATWNGLNDNLPSLDIRALAVSPRPDPAVCLAAASPDGLFISPDAGGQWEVLFDTPAIGAAFSPDGRLLAAAFQEDGIRVSTDLGRSWEKTAGPWDAGGRIAAFAIADDQSLAVALLEGAHDRLRLWHGRPGQYASVLSTPSPPNPLVSLWMPDRPGPAARWHAGMGNQVWTFGFGDGAAPAVSAVFPTSAPGENLLALAGFQHAAGQSVFACSGRRLYQSADGAAWSAVHEFEGEAAIAFALPPGFQTHHTICALLLGGAFCRGRLAGQP